MVAIAGKDYVVMGAGMWLLGCEGTVLSQKSQRLHELVDTSLGGVILAVAGCLAVRMNVLSSLLLFMTSRVILYPPFF